MNIHSFIDDGSRVYSCFVVVQEAVWLKRFMEDLDINISNANLVTIYCDREVAISFFKDAKYHSNKIYIFFKFCLFLSSD